MCGSNKPPPRPKKSPELKKSASGGSEKSGEVSGDPAAQKALHDMLAVSEIVRYLMGDVAFDASPATQVWRRVWG